MSTRTILSTSSRTASIPSWGRFKDRIRPAAGNHEYKVDHAADYFEYFGEAAGKIREGWYSYDVGDWHIVVLNSACLWVEWLRPQFSAGGLAQGRPGRASHAVHPGLLA